MLGASATGRLANVAQCVHDQQRGRFTAARQAQPGAFAHQLSCCGCSALGGGGAGGGDGYHTIHELAPNARVYTYSSTNPPGAVVQSGDAIEVQCLDASDGWLEASGPGSTTEHYAKRRHTPEIMEQFPGNPVCEPVFVEGAEPGDTLQVELLELRTADWGWTGVRRGFGLLDGDPLLTQDRLRIWKLHPETREPCELGETGIKVPYRPFCGCLGVAPPPEGQFEAGQPEGVVTIAPPNLVSSCRLSGCATSLKRSCCTLHRTAATSTRSTWWRAARSCCRCSSAAPCSAAARSATRGPGLRLAAAGPDAVDPRRNGGGAAGG